MTIKKSGKLRSLGIAAGTVGIFLASQVLFTLIFSFIGIAEDGLSGFDDYIMGNVSLITAISDLGAAAIVLLIFLCRKKNPFFEVGFRRVKPSQVGVAVALGVLMLVAVTGFLSLIPEDSSIMKDYSDAASSIEGESVFVEIFATVIVAPLVEEILFRGVILSRLKRSWSVPLSIILSSLIFGVLHGQILWILYAAATGAVLGAVYVRYNSIVPTIALHFTFNLLGGISFDADIPTWIFAAGGAAALAGVVLLIIKLYKSKGKSYVYSRELRSPDRAYESPAVDAPEPLIEVRQLSVKGGKNAVPLKNVELKVNKGEGFGIYGSYEDGRSALINALCGLTYYTKGSVSIGGYELGEQQKPLGEKMSVLLPVRNIQHTLTPEYLFRLCCGKNINPQQFRARMTGMFYRYGISGIEETAVGALDAKTFLTLSLVLSIANDPEIVFFDDNGQVSDAQTASIVKMFLADMRTQGKTVIIASGHKNLIEQFCGSAAVLSHGTVTAFGDIPALEAAGYM